MARLLAVTALVVGGAAATVAAGVTTEPSQISAYGPGWHGEPGGVSILGSSAGNQIVVRGPAPSTIVVSDESGATAVQGCHVSAPGGSACGCESIDSTTVSCHTPYGTDIGVAGMDGDDTIRALDPMVLRATGGRGADRLTGNVRNDFLSGVGRADVLSGRAGKDRLFTGPGRDFAYGGAGNDLLWVHDNDRDQVIDCGPGDDRAYIDRGLDPQPLRCEHIRYGPRGG